MSTFFLNRLTTEPHALAFAGQSTPWPVALADQTTDPSLDEALRGHVAAANRLLTPAAVASPRPPGCPPGPPLTCWPPPVVRSTCSASPRTRPASALQPTPPLLWKVWL